MFADFPVVENRIQITVRIRGFSVGGVKKLKTYVREFFWDKGIECNVETIRHSFDNQDVTTVILFEGDHGAVYSAKIGLIEAL
jgi:hypothetical protein